MCASWAYFKMLKRGLPLGCEAVGSNWLLAFSHLVIKKCPHAGAVSEPESGFPLPDEKPRSVWPIYHKKGAKTLLSAPMFNPMWSATTIFRHLSLQVKSKCWTRAVCSHSFVSYSYLYRVLHHCKFNPFEILTLFRQNKESYHHSLW